MIRATVVNYVEGIAGRKWEMRVGLTDGHDLATFVVRGAYDRLNTIDHGPNVADLWDRFCAAAAAQHPTRDAPAIDILRELRTVAHAQRLSPGRWMAATTLATPDQPSLFAFARSRQDLKAEYGWRVYHPAHPPSFEVDDQPSQVTTKEGA